MGQFPISTPSINPKPQVAPVGKYDPTIIETSYEEALDHVVALESRKLTTVGSSELHSGIHPTYGRCIIVISDASASIIPFA